MRPPRWIAVARRTTSRVTAMAAQTFKPKTKSKSRRGKTTKTRAAGGARGVYEPDIDPRPHTRPRSPPGEFRQVPRRHIGQIDLLGQVVQDFLDQRQLFSDVEPVDPEIFHGR